jgi:hypothetical protein
MRRNEGIRQGIGLAGALLFAVVGCDGTGNSTGDPSTGSESPALAGSADDTVQSEALQDEAMGLRAKIEFPDQGVVKFFEPQEGVVLIAEIGKNGTPPMIPASMTGMPATDLYQALAKQAAPAPLVEAVSRAALLKQRTPLTTAVPQLDLAPPALRAAETARASADSGLTQISSALTFSNSYDQWFYDNFCAGGKYVGNGWDYIVNWMYVTGTGSFQRNDMNWVDSTVSVYGGGAVHYRVQIRPWYSWSTTLDVQIQNGYYYKWHRDNGTDYDVYIYVDQASGDSYHWCSYGDSW